MRLRKILMVASVTFACVAQAQDLTIHVNKKGKVGFVDKNGAEVIKCAYESAYPFSGGYAIVTKSGKSGIIDERGKVVLPPEVYIYYALESVPLFDKDRQDTGIGKP